MSEPTKQHCEGSRHYFDIVDNKPLPVCRCGGYDRRKKVAT